MATTADLLARCALLGRLDRELLAEAAGASEAEVAELLAGGALEPLPGAPGVFQLGGDLLAAARARLRERPLADEQGLHERAFRLLLRRIATAGAAGWADDDEGQCFYHLGRLFVYLYLRLEWQQIAGHTAAAHTIVPRQARHRQRLAVYDAFVAIRTGDYERGQALLDELGQMPDLEDEVRLDRLLALGQMRRNLTHYDQALATYAQLGELARELGQPVYDGVARFNQGSVYTELDMYDVALERVQESLAIFEKRHDRERLAYAHYSVGLNAMYLGRWQLAQEHYGEAIRLFELLHMDATLATSYWSRGYLLLLLGDEGASERAYLRAIELTASAERGELIVGMDARLQLGFLYSTQGRHDEALAACERAEAHARLLRHDHRSSQIFFLRGRALEALGRSDEALAAYRRAADDIEALRSAHTSEDVKISLLGTTQQVFEAAVLLCMRLGRHAEAFEYVERARSRAFLDTLAERLPELYAALDRPVATLAEVQARLPEGALLLEYYTTGVMPRGEHIVNRLPKENARLREHLLLPAGTLVFAITRDGLLAMDAGLDPNPLRPQIGDANPSLRLLAGRICAQLYARLVAPAEGLVQASRLVYVAPHGPLHYVPFAALRPPDGGYLLEASGPALALVPSATVLVRSCLARPAAESGRSLALGYNDAQDAALQYAEHEALAAAAALGGEAWVGAAPKSARLAAAGPDLRRLHIAGHAVYDPREPLSSAITLGAGDTLSARDIMDRLKLRAELVTVSACTSGLSHVVPGDELLGLQRAFLYAGAATVVGTLWEAYDMVALLVMDRFYEEVRAGLPVAAALGAAQLAVRAMTGRDLAAVLARWRSGAGERPALESLPVVPPELYDTPLYADPHYWAPFIVIGRGE